MTKSSDDIRSLLGLAFEIEGLLMLAERRDDMTPAEVYAMLQDKCAALLDGATALNSATAPSCDAQPAPEAEAGPYTEAPSCDPCDDGAAENEMIAASASYEETEDAAGEPAYIPAPAPPVAPMPSPAPEAAPAPAPRPVTLTLNDKFRFRRSLFGGSDQQMTDTLAIIAGISSADDLTDFITNDLCWDPEDPEVVDFLAVATGSPR